MVNVDSVNFAEQPYVLFLKLVNFFLFNLSSSENFKGCLEDSSKSNDPGKNILNHLYSAMFL